MSRINTNIPALQGIHRYQDNQSELNLRLERLSTGLRINRGKDDPAGLIGSERLRYDIRGIRQAVENSTRANNVVFTAEGALNEASALLLDLQALIVSSANESGLLQEEIDANQLQIDSILASIDRIANTTTFAGKKLLDGSQSYLLSALPTAAVDWVSLFSVQVPHGGTRGVTVRVTQSAQTAGLGFLGSQIGGLSTTSAATIELKGTLGTELLSFASGTSLGDIRTAVNNITALTGVSAVVSTTTGAMSRSALVLSSTTFGSDAFVSVSPIGGNFIVSGSQGTTVRDVGVDAEVFVDGVQAEVKGLRADVRSNVLDARIYLTRAFGQKLSSATFTITGGGALFQITPQINPNGQINVGFNSIHTTQLGTATAGLLYSLGSGQSNDLSSRNFSTAQQILSEAISQISSYRGRLGNVQRNQIQTNINSQNVTLENVTASESVIRDADMAVEVSALTRAQILVQSTQTALQIANSLPRQILSLLGT